MMGQCPWVPMCKLWKSPEQPAVSTSADRPLLRQRASFPTTFKEQAETVWRNILAQLYAADMSAENLVKATTFLSDRKFREENRDVRNSVLNGHTFAMTVVLAGMFEDGWLLETDAIAEK